MPALPEYARVERSLSPGEHPLRALLPGLAKSPAIRAVAPEKRLRRRLIEKTRVLIDGPRGYCFVDVETQRIVVSEHYYATGSDLDLYLDLLHELTHLRQLDEGFDLWDERFEYIERPTEVEAYAVAVAEGRRLGMTPPQVRQHLENPWMSAQDVDRLLGFIEAFLSGGPLPNIEAAKSGAAHRAWRPWVPSSER
jgi:hypothetical protein